MDALLLGIDGTGPLSNKEYRAEMHTSFVNYIVRNSPAAVKRYERGPAMDGFDMTAIAAQSRWRWVFLALLPGLLSDLMFAGWVLSNDARSDAVAAVGTGLLYGGALLPLAAPFYLTELGRRYVRAVHGGYQSVTPFVLVYCAANFVLWLRGVLGVAAMSGLLGARLVGDADESTELQRRHSVWMFPAVILLHSIVVRALAPDLQLANLVAAVVALPIGLAFRWLRRATAVIAVMIAFTTFVFLWMFGIATPLSYLVLIGRRDWIPWAGFTNASALGVFLWLRVRASLDREWSKPLDTTAGVHIATQDWILRREFGKSEHPVFTAVAVLLGIILIPVFAFSRGRPEYLLFALFIGPLCIALMCTDGIARWIGFYVAVRRWEDAHGIRLRFPALRWGRPRERRSKTR